MPLILDADGLTIQTQEEIFNELASLVKTSFGVNTNTSTSSWMGQILNIVSEFVVYNQQGLLASYASFDPSQAEGVVLDARAALTGSLRRGETYSTVTGLIEFSGPSVVPDGSQIRNDDNQSVWESINGPYTDGGGPYPELVPAQFQAVDPGPILAQANTNWSTVSVIAGFADYSNPADDADLGRLSESDGAFRDRRNVELFSKTAGPREAISAQVSKISSTNGTIDYVRTYHNPTLSPTDSNGVPFKAYNVVVRTTPDPCPLALQQEIFDVLLQATGAGGQAYGTSYTGTATDIEGQTQDMAFDRLLDLDVYIQFDIYTLNNGQVFPPDKQQMADIIRAYVLEQAILQYRVIGGLVLVDDIQFLAWSLKANGTIKGVTNIDTTMSDDGINYNANGVVVGVRNIATYDSPRILINIDGAPY